MQKLTLEKLTDVVYAQNVEVLSEYRGVVETGKLPVERGQRISREG